MLRFLKKRRWGAQGDKKKRKNAAHQGKKCKQPKFSVISKVFPRGAFQGELLCFYAENFSKCSRQMFPAKESFGFSLSLDQPTASFRTLCVFCAFWGELGKIRSVAQTAGLTGLQTYEQNRSKFFLCFIKEPFGLSGSLKPSDSVCFFSRCEFSTIVSGGRPGRRLD